MSWLEESLKEAIQKNAEKYRRIIMDELNKKEAPTMQVTYNGFTGELVKLERKETVIRADPLVCRGEAKVFVYDLSIYDSEKHVTHSFTGVKLEDVKFLGGAVVFGE